MAKTIVYKLPTGQWFRYCQADEEQAHSDDWALTLRMALQHITLRHRHG